MHKINRSWWIKFEWEMEGELGKFAASNSGRDYNRAPQFGLLTTTHKRIHASSKWKYNEEMGDRQIVLRIKTCSQNDEDYSQDVKYMICILKSIENNCRWRENLAGPRLATVLMPPKVTRTVALMVADDDASLKFCWRNLACRIDERERSSR